jgi:LAO/AO transport system kinase
MLLVAHCDGRRVGNALARQNVALGDLVVLEHVVGSHGGAEQTVGGLRAELGPSGAPIVSLVAAKGEGLSELMAAIDAHHCADSRARRLARARAQILSLAQIRLRTHPELDRLAESVVDGRDDPYAAAEQLLVPAPPSR